MNAAGMKFHGGMESAAKQPDRKGKDIIFTPSLHCGKDVEVQEIMRARLPEAGQGGNVRAVCPA